MRLNDHMIRLTLGLKVKQLRLEKGISLTDLAHKTQISISYLNEIEKGKKQPKPSKVSAIAEALGVTYDWLVSTQLSRHLKPIGELLRSNVLRDLPLEHFGLDQSRLIDLFATGPAKLSAFVNTLLEISRSYSLTTEQFYFSALRSYQELHDNYFPDLEDRVDAFRAEFEFEANRTPGVDELTDLLTDRFGVTVQPAGLAHHPALSSLRAVYQAHPGERPTLLLNPALSEPQRAFALARELAFHYLALKPRPYTASWVRVGSFEEVLHNFYASYFAGALLIGRQALVEDLRALFEQPTWQPEAFLDLMRRYRATPEMLLHRLTSLLPRFFDIRQLFFLRFGHKPGARTFSLTKELHLSGLQSPHATFLRERYCRRWVSLTILRDLAEAQARGEGTEPMVGVQRSRYLDSGREYLVLALARPMSPVPNLNWSVSLGLFVDDNLRQKIAFLDDARVPRRDVNETCERCGLPDCQERSAPPVIYERQRAHRELVEALDALGHLKTSAPG